MITAAEAHKNAQANEKFQVERDSIYRLIEEQSKKGFFNTETQVSDYHYDPLFKELTNKGFKVQARFSAQMGSSPIKHRISISW